MDRFISKCFKLFFWGAVPVLFLGDVIAMFVSSLYPIAIIKKVKAGVENQVLTLFHTTYYNNSNFSLHGID